MHGKGITIWFFIGVLLAIYGVLILGYGLVEWTTGNYAAGVQLTQLHTPVWWGSVLAALGVFYLVKFRPGRGK
jgi:uncharacterized membrane protein YidH (DUF202 family)